MRAHIKSLSPAEAYVLFQQSGLLGTMGRSRAFVRALATGRFPHEELDRFVAGEPSLVDAFITDPTMSLEGVADSAIDAALVAEDDVIGFAESAQPSSETEPELPLVQTRDALSALDFHAVTSADEEAVEFLLASAAAKLWRHAFRDLAAARNQAMSHEGGAYAQKVRDRFLAELESAETLAVPEGYTFRIDGRLALPNLMQRLIAVRVRDRRRVGNWSGTGAGKTLSAVLASRVVDARVTVICCPNAVVDGWCAAIRSIFPDSLVVAKTFEPDWSSIPDQALGFGGLPADVRPRYLVLNYEAFQQPDSALRVRRFADSHDIDMIVVDEIHFAKQRSAEDMSRRRQLVTALTAISGERNPDLCVLGMSATPVINNLQEGRSMVELVAGMAHEELETRATIANCMRLHQRLVTLGIRWMPEYDLAYEQVEVDVDCAAVLDDIRALGKHGSPLELEQVLTRARLPVILEQVRPKTVIYTHYVSQIDRQLRDALVDAGWRVGFYTGDDKTGLDAFIHGDLDVLIGSSAISTGVDGLQHVCKRMIVNVLPWTAAEFEQLKGRIFRQGQVGSRVTMVLPLTFAEVSGERWSWCRSKMQRLQFKKSIADAAVDGVVPEGHLRTASQAYQDVMGWLQRIDAGELQVVARTRLVIPLPVDEPDVAQGRQRRYGDFSQLNRKWNGSRSDLTHERLQVNPEEWAHYHTLYREARRDWPVVPFEEMVRWCREREGKVIGDFGCGEALLAQSVSDRHTVHSFDHVAINDEVVVCDMAHVPLDDDVLDVAIFSLSLMGSNLNDYLREAHRTLKLDGQLHIYEATSRFTDRDQFTIDLSRLGYDLARVEDVWKFTHILAIKSGRRAADDLRLTL
jgi:hypothetical protein